jgi:ubiquinone/menaquinone biosynthesis C-methylase UbiE
VVKALRLRPGQIVCDIGAGPGYFALRLARAVGPQGQVYAVDVDPRILEVLSQRIEKAGAKNITPVLGLAHDPLVAPGRCDRILMVNTYHHFPDGPAYLRRLAQSLAPGGLLINVDFHKRETPVGPPQGHRVAREDFLRAASQARFKVTEEPAFLANQYFIILEPTSGDPGRTKSNR